MKFDESFVYFIYFIHILSVYNFLTFFLNAFMNKKCTILNYICLLFSLVSTYFRFSNRNYFNILILLFFLIVIYLSYTDLKKQRIFFITFALVLVIFCNSIYMCLNLFVFQHFHFINGNHCIHLLIELIQPLILLFIYLYFKRYNLRFKTIVLKDDEWSLYITMTISAIGYLLLVNHFMWIMEFKEQITRIIIFVGFISFLAITYYLFFLYLRNTYRKNRELMEVKQKLDTQEFNTKLYEQMKESYEANRKLKHDLVGHIGMIKELMDVDVEKAKDYIDQLYGHIDQTSIAMSESEAINCILNSRCDRIKKENISVKYEIESTLDTIKDFDLTIILGNLFDNAIEAQAYVEDKRIRVQIWEDDKYHYINFINHCNMGIIHEVNGEFKTTKTNDAGIHGIGISNVKECVKWYHGQFQQSIQGGNFISSIYIPRHFE